MSPVCSQAYKASPATSPSHFQPLASLNKDTMFTESWTPLGLLILPTNKHPEYRYCLEEVSCLKHCVSNVLVVTKEVTTQNWFMVLCECSHSFYLLSVFIDSQVQMNFLYIPLKGFFFSFSFLSLLFLSVKVCYGVVSGFIKVMKCCKYSELCNQSYSI